MRGMRDLLPARELPTVPAGEVRWTLADAALVLLGAQLLALVWAVVTVSTAYADGEIPDPLPIAVAVVANGGLWMGYLVGPIATARRKGGGPVADYGARVELGDVPVGLVLGIVAQLVVLPVLYWPILRIVDGDPSGPARELLETVDTPVEWLVVTVMVAVIAPLVEELAYRGLLLRAIQARFGTIAAVLVTSAVFAAVHRQLLPLPGLFVFGLIAALLTVYTGRLGPAWALHVGFNATTLVVLGLSG